MTTTAAVPVIDLAGSPETVGAGIDAACRHHGFFAVGGHGVDMDEVWALHDLAREFFALPEEEKELIAMPRAGRAWRGWFPLEGELTSGTPDLKEGLYFGRELPPSDPRVRAGLALHGPNLFPARPADLGRAVLAHLKAMTALGQRLLALMATGLGLDPGWFVQHLTAEPVILFRIFQYPPHPPAAPDSWGVGEHTDYGLLTILHQDRTGGLEIRTGNGWVAVPPVEGTFVCNLGDMLERMTGGRYRSTPHRVRNTSPDTRISLPFFMDPSWDARITPLPLGPAERAPTARWDGADVFAFDGLYGDYLTAKVAKVFPHLQ